LHRTRKYFFIASPFQVPILYCTFHRVGNS
jgi:hypothetical protein